MNKQQEFNPEVMHESRELAMQIPDAVARSIKEALEELYQQGEEETVDTVMVDRYEDQNR